ETLEFVVLVHPDGGWKQIPAGDEQRGKKRTDDEAVKAEYRQAPQGGYQNDIIRDFGVVAHQQRPQDVVNQADHQYAEQGQDDTLPDGARNQKVDRDRHPNDGGTNGG